MKSTPNMFGPLWDILRSNLSGWYVLLALLFMSVVLSGCEKEEVLEECWETQLLCTTAVTAETVNCGYGAFGNVWLKTADGKYLQPWHNQTAYTALVPGQTYTVGVQPTKRDNKYDDVYTCLAAVPDAEPVTVACISAALKS